MQILSTIHLHVFRNFPELNEFRQEAVKACERRYSAINKSDILSTLFLSWQQTFHDIQLRRIIRKATVYVWHNIVKKNLVNFLLFPNFWSSCVYITETGFSTFKKKQ